MTWPRIIAVLIAVLFLGVAPPAGAQQGTQINGMSVVSRLPDISVTSSSARTQLATSSLNIWLNNSGSTDAVCALGDVTVTAVAATSPVVVPAGWAIVVQRGSATYIACITASSTTTLRVMQGNGSPLMTRGGSGAPPIGAAGGALSGTYPNPSLASISQIATSLAIGGATIGTDALAWTGTATGSGALTAGSFIPTSSTVPTNGMYLSAANTLGFAVNSTIRFTLSSNGIAGTNGSGPRIVNNTASSTLPTLVPNQADTTTGIGAQAAGNISLIAGATERARIATGAASVSDILLPGTLFTGGTATTTFPQILVQPTGTSAVTSWSTSGTIFGANVVSGFAGNFLDFHVAGGASVFSVGSNGATAINGDMQVGSAGLIRWNGRGIFTSPAAGTIQLGSGDAASPVAQTFRAQSVVAGTSNAAGTLWTFQDSIGTGTGVSGGYSFFVHPAGTTGTAQNAQKLALGMDSTGTVRLSAGFTVSTLPAAGTAGRFAYVTDQLTTCAVAGAALTGGGAVTCPVFDNGTAWVGG